MPRYEVTISVTGTYKTEVFGRTEEDAIESAQEKFNSLSDKVGWAVIYAGDHENIEYVRDDTFEEAYDGPDTKWEKDML